MKQLHTLLVGMILLCGCQSTGGGPAALGVSAEQLSRHLIVIHRLSIYQPREQNMPVSAEDIEAAQACKDAVVAGQRFSGGRTFGGYLDQSVDRYVDRAADNINRCLSSRGRPVFVLPTGEPVEAVLR